MKIYRVETAYYRTQDEAKKAARAASTDWHTEEMPVKQAEVIAFLNRIAGTTPSPPPRHAAHTSSVMPSLDDLWSSLPLGAKLHFASLALGEAYVRVVAERTAPYEEPEETAQGEVEGADLL
jgi:hypothetical protein